MRFVERPETTATVSVVVPMTSGNERQEFTARFLVLPETERREIAADPRAALERVWLGWEGIEDANGKPVAFSEAARRRLLDYDYILVGLAQAYVRATSGIERKN